MSTDHLLFIRTRTHNILIMLFVQHFRNTMSYLSDKPFNGRFDSVHTPVEYLDLSSSPAENKVDSLLWNLLGSWLSEHKADNLLPSHLLSEILSSRQWTQALCFLRSAWAKFSWWSKVKQGRVRWSESGGNYMQGFPKKQGVFTLRRVCLLFK